jgi:transposase
VEAKTALKIRKVLNWIFDFCSDLFFKGDSGKGSKKGGRPRASKKLILLGIFNILKTGGSWRTLPCTYGPYQTVYHYFNQWSKDGTFVKAYRRLLKVTKPDLRAAVIDASHTMAPLAPYDLSKIGPKILGKRAIKINCVINRIGVILGLYVAPANIHDSQLVEPTIRASKENIEVGRKKQLKIIYADAGYIGDEPKKAAKQHSVTLNAIERPSQVSRPIAKLVKRRKIKRCIVEHGFSWKNQWRRLKVVYEKMTSTMLAMQYLGAMAIAIGKLF